MTDEPSSSPTAGPGDPVSYAAATEELEAVLRRLEQDDVDVDRLVVDVARAAELLAWCRDRLRATALEIDEVVADLGGDTAPPAGA